MASAQTTEAAHYAMSQKNATKAYYSSLLDNPNVQRGLAVIRATEGTAKKNNPYSTAFGGGTIKDLSKHPETRHSFTQKNGKKNTTTAAGAYQFLSRTWKSVANKLGLTDFGKMSQDVAALALIDGRNGLEALIAGDLVGFVNAVGPEWASLPTAPDAYSQPKVGWNKVKQAWESYKPGDEIDPTSPEAIAAAYNSPSRGLDVIGGLGAPPAADQKLANAQIAYGASRAMNAQPPSMSPPNPGALRGLATSLSQRGIGAPSNFSAPARPSPIGSAPVGQVTRSPLGPALARPSPPSNFAQGTMPSAISRPSAPPSNFAKGTMPTAPAKAAGTPTAGYNTKAQAAGTPTAGYNVSMPSGISRPAAPSQASIQGALSQAAGKIAADTQAYSDFESARAQGLSSLPAPPPTVNHPPNPTVGVPAPVAAPIPAAPAPVQTVLSPPQQLMGPPRENFAYAPPAATAYDVYSGMADTAMDNTGQNRVSSIPGGTSVTNKYGATTGMVGQYQTAVGSMPSIPGMSGPVASKIGQSVKAAAPKVGLGLLGGLIAGPIGALAGALLGNQIAKQSALAKPSAAAPGASSSRGGSSAPGGSRAGANNGVRPGGGGYQTSVGAQSLSHSPRY